MIRYIFLTLCIVAIFMTCKTVKNDLASATNIEDVAATEEAAAALKKFEGRGALTDESLPTSPTEALKQFQYPSDISMELVLAEPQVVQPLFMNFDHRGRLWVVQYQQYPYPKGLKVMSIDNHLRIKFDKMPEAPPTGVKGADKITVYEDTNGDGKYDKATDAITGLNIATSVVLGRKKIWVLNPPYLIAFPDKNEDGLPDGQPEVHLSGFGLEDTHAVANSLRWGPDGWLYGAQGSTTTATISSKVSKNVAFKGQVIWRYHPETSVFEIFAEGGGNTFYVEIDDKGRIYSGDNGYSRGMYYKQGGYYPRNLDKHGPYTNPYTFGQLPNMPIEGEKKRFTHAWLKYQENSLPARYQDKIIAINPLQSYLQVSRFEERGSNFKNVDEEILLKTNDRWFRPVDIKTGPDGAVYIADWYDSRLSHVDARDTWHKSSGRIYRLKSQESEVASKKFDLTKYSNQELIAALSSPNRWLRQQILQVIADKQDKSLVPALELLLEKEQGQVSLEALWAINLLGHFENKNIQVALTHRDPFVRMWAVRLLGDRNKLSTAHAKLFIELAQKETHPEVRSQLISSAKRLDGTIALSIIKEILLSKQDEQDPDIPLLIWWTLESKLMTESTYVLDLWKNRQLWNNKIVEDLLAKNIGRRLTLGASPQELVLLRNLLESVPFKEKSKAVLEGVAMGISAKPVDLPTELLQIVKTYESVAPFDVLTIGLSQQVQWAQEKASVMLEDAQVSNQSKAKIIAMLGNSKANDLHVLLLPYLQHSSVEVKMATLQALQNDDHISVAENIIKVYPTHLQSNDQLQSLTFTVLTSRVGWIKQLISAIREKKVFNKQDIPVNIIQQLIGSNDPTISKLATELWPERASREAKQKHEQVQFVQRVLKTGEGNRENGKQVFMLQCGSCHKLFNEGGTIGPDLTGYDRRNTTDFIINTVDPSAEIREGYVLYQIDTYDGRQIVGKLVGQDGSTYTLQPLAGNAVTIQQAHIKNKIAQSVSIMPEGLLESMKEQEIRDLFAYITQLK